MKQHSIKRAAVVVALAFSMATVAAQDGATGNISAGDVHQALMSQGYADVTEIKFDDGMWEAEARREDGRRVDVRIDARTGRIYPEDGRTALAMSDIEDSLTAAGYTRIHDVKFDDGLWEAEAYDADGVEYELYLDPETAVIVGRKRD